MLPTVSQLASKLRRLNAHIEATGAFDEPVDVAIRMTVLEDGTWTCESRLELASPKAVAFGYAWIPGRNKRFKARAVATDLLEQVESTLAARDGRE